MTKFVANKAQTFRVALSALKVEAGCYICGYSANPSALEFVGVANIAEMIGRHSLASILSAVSGSRVACVDCNATPADSVNASVRVAYRHLPILAGKYCACGKSANAVVDGVATCLPCFSDSWR